MPSAREKSATNGAPDGLGAMSRKLFGDLRELTQLEIELAKAELAEKGRHAILGVVLFLVAALSVFLLLAALVTAAILAVAIAVPGWAAALVVAGFLAILAGVLALVGTMSLRSAFPPVPRQAIKTTKENIEWLRTRLRSGSE